MRQKINRIWFYNAVSDLAMAREMNSKSSEHKTCAFGCFYLYIYLFI